MSTSTLLTIPGCTAVHNPTPSTQPLPLATGDLTLSLIPANPPTHPSATVTLSVGSAAFPLLPNHPVQRVKAKQEHPSYQFTPVPADGGMSVGTVRINMKDSKNQGEWEATEALCKQLESQLKTHGLWDEKVLFVNDEYDTSGTPVKGWGETVAATVLGGATSLATKIATFTETHLPETKGQPRAPSIETAAKIAAVRQSTANLADNAELGANALGQKIHDAGKSLGAQLPDNVARPSKPVREAEKSEFRKIAEETWSEVTVAAKGIAQGATTVGRSISENVHKAVEHNYGRQADNVAQDIGQAGSNLASVGVSAIKATSVVVQGDNVVQGVHASRTDDVLRPATGVPVSAAPTTITTTAAAPVTPATLNTL